MAQLVSWLLRDLGAKGPKFDNRISRPYFDFFLFRIA